MSVRPTRAGPRHRVASGLLLPGKVIGDGRYRLLERTGTDERNKAHLWRARDGQLGRDVALTILTGDPGNAGAVWRVRRSLARAAHPVSLAHPGIAPVLNVVSVGDGVARDEGVLGMIAAEWTRGAPLTSLVAQHPVPPAAACQLLEPLAAAVGQAHHDGLVLGVGHPLRIRAATGAGLRLAFPGPPDSRLRDDVRGLGVILYLLLTGRWPAIRRPGMLKTPREIRPEVPSELSDVAMRCLDEDAPDSIRTSDTILQVLRQVAPDAERTERIMPVTGAGVVWTTKPPAADPVRKKRLAIGVAVLLITAMAVMAWIGTTVAGLFGADTGASPGPSAAVTPPPNSAPQQGSPIPPAGVEVFAGATGTPARTIDGDPSSSWQTTKPGVGLIVIFPRPVRPVRVSIDSPSAGTQVEIRATPAANANLADTTLLGSADLTAGSTTIELRGTIPAQRFIVRLTQLGGTGQTAINELTFTE